MEVINELAEALSKAQGEMENAVKDSTNPFFKSHYADLASVILAIKIPLSKNGLSYVQLVKTDNGITSVETILMHRSGQSISASMIAKPAKDDMQSLGSAITYARRYSLQAMVGLSAEDDDGEKAIGRIALKPEYIDDKQKSNLVDGITDLGIPITRFLEYMKINSLDTMTKADYPKAIVALEAKKKAKEAEAK